MRRKPKNEKSKQHDIECSFEKKPMFHDAAGHSESKLLFILAEPRSSSSWLLETLNSHPDITLASELYNHVQFQEVQSFHQIEK